MISLSIIKSKSRVMRLFDLYQLYSNLSCFKNIIPLMKKELYRFIFVFVFTAVYINCSAQDTIVKQDYITSFPRYGGVERGNIMIEVSIPIKNDLWYLLDLSFNMCFSDTLHTSAISYEISLYNRWGELVVSRCALDECWNGKDDGAYEYLNGVYFLNFYVQLQNNEVKRYLNRIVFIQL